MSDPVGHPIGLRPARLLILAAIVIAIGWLPVASVSACSCAFFGLPQAIAQSDVAFIGTVIARGQTDQRDGVWETTRVGFAVGAAKEAMPTPVVVNARLGSGASCGLEMALGEEWLVIASFNDGRAETNLCSGSAPLATLDEATMQQVMVALDVEPVPVVADDPLAGMSDGGVLPDTPLGILIAAAAVLLISIASLVAFRRSHPG